MDAKVDRTSVSGIENEAFSVSIDTLDRLAAALDVDVSDLIANPDASDPPPKTLKPGRKAK